MTILSAKSAEVLMQPGESVVLRFDSSNRCPCSCGISGSFPSITASLRPSGVELVVAIGPLVLSSLPRTRNGESCDTVTQVGET